jgi:flagellar motor switch protein FliN/FliY
MTDQLSGTNRSLTGDRERKNAHSDGKQAVMERFCEVFRKALANAFALRTGKVPEVAWRVTERLQEEKLLAGYLGDHLIFQTSLMDADSGAVAVAVSVEESDLLLHLAGAENHGGADEIPDHLTEAVSGVLDDVARELGDESRCLLTWNPLVDSVRSIDSPWFHDAFPGSTMGIRSQFEVSMPGRIPSTVSVIHSDAFVDLLENEIFTTAAEDEINVQPAGFQELSPSLPKEEPGNLDLLLDVGLTVRVELGRTSLRVQEVLELGPGSVVELDKLAGEPVDLLVNEQLFARGEVVVIDENFGVRVTDIVSPRERINAMRRGS